VFSTELGGLSEVGGASLEYERSLDVVDHQWTGGQLVQRGVNEVDHFSIRFKPGRNSNLLPPVSWRNGWYKQSQGHNSNLDNEPIN